MNLTEWEQQGKTLAHNSSTVTPWAIADWLLLSERVGMGSKYERAAEILAWTPAACRVSACVGRAFPPAERYDILTFGHHAAVASLEPTERRDLLEKAVGENLSVGKLRAAVRQLKTPGEAEPKAREPRFVLEGLDKGTLAYLQRFASDKGIPVASYVSELLAAHVTERNAKTPEQRLSKYEADRARELDKVKELAVLADRTIHAKTWKERTQERCRLLLYLTARETRPELSDFVSLFESVFGAEKFPMKWVLSCINVVFWKNVSCLAVYKHSDIVPADYTDAEENRRIKLLKEEHAQIKSENPNLYDKRHIDFRASNAYRGFERATEGGEALYNKYFHPTSKLLTEGVEGDADWDAAMSALVEEKTQACV